MSNIKISALNRKAFIIHALIWAFILLLPFIFSNENQKSKDADDIGFRNLNTATMVFWVGLFYLNAFILIPSLIYLKRYLQYIFTLLLLFCVVMFLHGSLFPLLVPAHHFDFLRSSVHNLTPFLFTIALSATYKILRDKIKSDTEKNERQKENLKSELSFLRSQISPHFLFNVLNNIVAMVRLKSEELEPTVMKLSSLLQYMLYETDEEKVLLRNETEYLQSYIDLQQMRFSSKLNMQVRFEVMDEWEAIEPMLLIPFIENAFKHGNGLLKNPEIHVALKAENNLLDFHVKNKYIETDKSKDKISGIGLANVKRRLELLYENRHTLSIVRAEEWFHISLQITLGK